MTAIRESILQPGMTARPVFRHRTAAGGWRFLEVVATNCLDDPAIGGIVLNAHDVTDQTYLARALRTVTQGNQVVVRATDEASLLADTCRQSSPPATRSPGSDMRSTTATARCARSRRPVAPNMWSESASAGVTISLAPAQRAGRSEPARSRWWTISAARPGSLRGELRPSRMGLALFVRLPTHRE